MPARNPFATVEPRTRPVFDRGEPKEPRLVPMFGSKPFGANTTCEDIHRGPIPAGSSLCCMANHCTGGKTEKWVNRRLEEDRIDPASPQNNPEPKYEPGELLGGTEKKPEAV